MLQQAQQAGISVVSADNRVTGLDAPHLATDNLKAGAQGADKLVEVLKSRNVPLKGKVSLISAVAGIEVLSKRDEGFTERLAEIAPDLKVLPVRYVDNDIQKAMSAASDQMLANADLVGFFGDNNHTGDGVALAVRDAGRGGKVAAVAFDSDPEEVRSLSDGLLDALILQDPYGMGYKGVDYVVRQMKGEKLPAYTDTGALSRHQGQHGRSQDEGSARPVQPQEVMDRARGPDGPGRLRDDSMTPPVVSMRGIGKTFAGVVALSGVDLDLRSGEVHALLGENGAGKSTLIKILMGVHARSSGTTAIDGQERAIASPLDAQALGLSAVYQDVTLAPHLSVAENFFLGHLPLSRGLVDWGRVHAESAAFLASLGIDVDVRAKVSSLTIARQQLVAVAKVVWTGARLMIFDEPTALLTNSETEMLFGLIRRLKKDGKAILYVSHRMEEIFALCDRATVLRDGRLVRTLDVCDTTPDGVVALMVGREIVRSTPTAAALRFGECCSR